MIEAIIMDQVVPRVPFDGCLRIADTVDSVSDADSSIIRERWTFGQTNRYG
jgi:hypothetical protein